MADGREEDKHSNIKSRTLYLAAPHPTSSLTPSPCAVLNRIVVRTHTHVSHSYACVSLVHTYTHMHACLTSSELVLGGIKVGMVAVLTSGVCVELYIHTQEREREPERERDTNTGMHADGRREWYFIPTWHASVARCGAILSNGAMYCCYLDYYL